MFIAYFFKYTRRVKSKCARSRCARLARAASCAASSAPAAASFAAMFAASWWHFASYRARSSRKRRKSGSWARHSSRQPMTSRSASARWGSPLLTPPLDDDGVIAATSLPYALDLFRSNVRIWSLQSICCDGIARKSAIASSNATIEARYSPPPYCSIPSVVRCIASAMHVAASGASSVITGGVAVYGEGCDCSSGELFGALSSSDCCCCCCPPSCCRPRITTQNPSPTAAAPAAAAAATTPHVGRPASSARVSVSDSSRSILKK